MHSFVIAVEMNEEQGVGACNEHGSNKQHFFLQLGPLSEVSAKRPNSERFLDKCVSHHKK